MHLLMTTTDWWTLVGYLGFLCFALWSFYKMYPNKKVVQAYHGPLKNMQAAKWLTVILMGLILGLWVLGFRQFLTTRMTPSRLAHNQQIIKQIKLVDTQIDIQQKQLIFDKTMLSNETKPKLVYHYLVQRNQRQAKLMQLIGQRYQLSKHIYRSWNFLQLFTKSLN